MGWDKDWERSLPKYHHGQNRLKLGILIKLITKKNQSRIMRGKINLKNTLLHPSLIPSSTSPHPAVHGDREWGFWPGYPRLFLPLLMERNPSPDPVWGPSQGRWFSMNFSTKSPSHRQQFSINFCNLNHKSKCRILHWGQCGCMYKSEEESGEQPCRMRSGELGQCQIEYAVPW